MAVEEQPLLLVIDDAQWLDPGSADAVTAALRDLAELPFTLVLCLPRRRRPEWAHRLEAELGRRIEGATVTLPPLSLEAIRQLAANAFPKYGPEQLDRLARRVERDSAGFPLLATQIIAAARQGLALAGEEAAWPSADRTLEQTLPAELPENARVAIRVNFRRLSKEAQRVLSVAAALPEDRLTPSRLAALAELDERTTATALDELEWERWLVSDPAGYGFVAKIVRDAVAADMLTPGQRARLRAAGGA